MSEKTKKNLNIVAVFAHPDDEAGIIGTLANHTDRKDKVTVIFLTRGENASSLCCSPDEIMNIRLGHAKKIEKILNAEYRLLDMPDSGVVPSIENAKKIATQFKELKPDIIITWGKTEQIGAGHPDHRYTHDLTIDAISYARYKNPTDKYTPHREAISLYTTLITSESITKNPFFIDVTNQYDKIMAVLDIYTEAYGKWPVKEFITNQLLIFGRMAGIKYAEAYNKIIWRTAQQYLF